MAAIPRDLPRKYRAYWLAPWTTKAARSVGFRRWLKKHGYLTPHFRTSESTSKDGRKVPRHLAYACRQHAFRLERLRHALGGHPVPIVSWYRSPQRNAAVGGARRSKHMEAIATDHPITWVRARGGQPHIRSIASRLGFKGIGVYPGGNVHLDSRRGPLTVWSSWTR